MASDQKVTYVCQKCGSESPRWEGRCSGCGTWNSLVETIVKKAPLPRGASLVIVPQRLKDLASLDTARITTGVNEFDRCLGGGLIAGEIVLLSGEPGVGKSTLLLQVMGGLKSFKGDVLYVCGEESPLQVKSRAERLQIVSDNLVLLSQTQVEPLLAYIKEKRPLLVVLDSIQSMTSLELHGSAGSIGQVRESAYLLSQTAKELGIPMILVGHVTKEGSLAGPKVLEHLVDAVLDLEGDSRHSFRILRATKNRFGSVHEVGVFEMTGDGMRGVSNPSDRFLEERLEGVPGSVVTVLLEGMRPMLVEIQALASTTSFGFPRRTASGFALNRLLLLLAVIEKRVGVSLQNQDIYVNVAAGLKAAEPAVDLAVCLAVLSSLKETPLKSGTVVFGEVGLSGEVRGVPQSAKRNAEAHRLGYKTSVSPESVKTISQAVDSAFNPSAKLEKK